MTKASNRLTSLLQGGWALIGAGRRARLDAFAGIGARSANGTTTPSGTHAVNRVSQPTAAGKLSDRRSPYALLRSYKIAIPFIVCLAFLVFGVGVASAEGLGVWWGLTGGSRPSRLVGGHARSEVQELTAAPGEVLTHLGAAFHLFVNKVEVGTFATEEVAVAFGLPEPTAGNVQAALEAPAGYGVGDVVVTGGPATVAPLIVTVPDHGVHPLEVEAVPTSTASVRVLAAGQADGQLVVTAENRGDEVSAGPVRVRDVLPAGLRAAGVESVAGRGGEALCSMVSVHEVQCVFEGGLPAFEEIEIRVGVALEPGAHSGEVNVASVSGGGAVGTRVVSRPIVVGGSEGFGVEDFQMVPENAGGGVDTQAGSHPFQLTSVVSFDSGGGLVKDAVAELPPGLIGNPSPFAQCTDAQFATKPIVPPEPIINECPADAAVGVATVTYSLPGELKTETVPIFNMVPLRGEPARFGFKADGLVAAFLDSAVRTGGDYAVTVGAYDVAEIARIRSTKLTFWGVPGAVAHEHQRGWECLREFGTCPQASGATPPPFLIMPASCTEPFASTLRADTWASTGNPSETAEETYTLKNSAGQPTGIDGCDHLPFSPSIEVKPDVANASTSTGLTVDVHLPQTAELNPEGLAESPLRNATVTLPEGVAVNPSGGNGLEACSGNPAALGGALGSPGDQIGYEGKRSFPSVPGTELLTFTSKVPGSFGTEGEEATLKPGLNFCPNASKIGTVKFTLPILPHPLEGAVYLADQNANPFGSLIAMYAVAEDPVSGVLAKVSFNVTLDPSTGQLVATSENSPQAPLETAEFHFFGGERAPLATPAHCGSYTTSASLTPWSGNAAVTATSTFDIEHGPGGGACPGASLPFSPSLTGGATNLNAGAFSPFTLTMTRHDGEQNLQSVEAKLPPGLSGVLSNIELCPEPQANLGECGPNSLIGETTVSVGVGGKPFTVSGGKFYLTGPYNGSGGCKVSESGCAPFGLTFEVPAKAGPFDLERNAANPAGEDACDCVLVRGKIEINPYTAALTITSNPPGTPDAIPTSIEGIPLEIQKVNAITTRGNFQFNPTNCSKMEVTGTIHSSVGGTDKIGVPFQVTNCKDLSFTPKFKVSTNAKTSKANGASLTTSVTEPVGSLGTQANLTKVKVELPEQLPSRLTTLQKACTSKQFEANPAACPSESKIGYAVVHTPLVPVPLEGPAIFVSHGGEAFPSLTMVLQGYGVTIDLVGTTFISKAGVTSTTFKTVPDQPFSSFALTLPTGKFSALTALGNVCAEKLTMPTEFIAQNGMEIHQITPIGVTGCKKSLTRAQRLAAALKACHKKKGSKRTSCEKAARKKFGPLKKGKGKK